MMRQTIMTTRVLFAVLLIAAGTMTGYAQSDCFTYEDNDETIISGLTVEGQAAEELTIPVTVTTVRSGAFDSASPSLVTLTIDGGNPAFATGLFWGILTTTTIPRRRKTKPFMPPIC